MARKAQGSNQYKSRWNPTKDLASALDLVTVIRQEIDRSSETQLSPAMLNSPLSDLDPAAREKVARHPHCSQLLMQQLASDAELNVRVAVAARLDCPEQILTQMSNDQHPQVRLTVAINPQCPPRVVEALSQDEDPTVRGCAGTNIVCPVSALEKLAQDPDMLARAGAAANRRCPIDKLRMLAHDQQWQVRHMVANNPSCPPALGVLLSEDSSMNVALAANNRYDTAAVSHMQWASMDDRKLAALDPTSKPEILAHLALSSKPELRCAVGTNQSCPPEVRDRLRQDEDDSVRKAVG